MCLRYLGILRFPISDFQFWVYNVVPKIDVIISFTLGEFLIKMLVITELPILSLILYMSLEKKHLISA